jgi:hypothetical protein
MNNFTFFTSLYINIRFHSDAGKRKAIRLQKELNRFQSNFSANRILPSSYFILGGKEVGGLIVIFLQF